MLDTSVMFLAATPASVRPGFRPTRGSVVDGLSGPAWAESTAGTANRGHRQHGGGGGERPGQPSAAARPGPGGDDKFHRRILWLNGTDGLAPDHRLPSRARMRSISMR